MEDFRQIFESRYTWLEGFRRNVMRFGDKIAMIDPDSGRTWTYAELDRESNRLANAFASDGVGAGDVVMLHLGNCPEFVFSYIAAQKLRAVCCPVNFRLSSGELAFVLDDSAPKVVLCWDAVEPVMEEALRTASHSPARVIVVERTYGPYVEDRSGADPAVDGAYNIYDETTRLYTSGTTGRPKSVSLSSINEVLSAHDVMIHFPMSFRDVTMNTTPWFHRGGLHCAGPCPAFYAGATIVVQRKFDPEATLRLVSKYGITFLVGVPTVLENLADAQEVKRYDISSLKGIVTMGSPLERGACIRYQKILTPNIFNGYGTTETFWNTFLRPFDLPEHAGSAGGACVDDDVRVVRVYDDRRAEPDDLVPCGSGEVGEVIICSPAKSPYRYCNNPDETAEKYYKGFLYTHDLATWDEHHYITIVGRKDDMIISSGENIYPTEVEAVLNRHPSVKDCMVTAVPDVRRGQLVTAYIIPREGVIPDAEALDLFCKESPEIASFKRPRYYRFVSALPFNATGKKLHARMKEMAFDDLRNGLLYRV